MKKTALPSYFSTALMLLASTPAQSAAPTIPPVVDASNLLQISFSLLLVLAVIIVLAWVLRRMNLTQQGTGNFLKIIGSVALGQRERAVLIEVGDTWLLVGVGPGQIRTLHTLTKNEDWQAEVTAPADKKFSQLLSSVLKHRQSDRKSNAS